MLDGEDIASALDAEGDNLQTLFDETGAPCWDPDPITDGPCIVNGLGDAAASSAASTAGPAADASFVSTQFAPVEEAEKFRNILGDIEVTISEDGPMIDQILANRFMTRSMGKCLRASCTYWLWTVWNASR